MCCAGANFTQNLHGMTSLMLRKFSFIQNRKWAQNVYRKKLQGINDLRI
jgi:hypothetical protein